MPAGKPSQSNAMLYTVIIFVGLFIAALVCAIAFYVKAEDYKTQYNEAIQQTEKLAKANEVPAKLIGKPLRGESYLGTMNTYLDEMISAITGQIPENSNASVKINETKTRINETMELLAEDASAIYGPEGISLLQTIEKLKLNIDTANENSSSAEQLLS